jgi:hypothetical protein
MYCEDNNIHSDNDIITKNLINSYEEFPEPTDEGSPIGDDDVWQ